MDQLKDDVKWGPGKLRDILNAISKGVNRRTPIAGVGIDISEEKDGVQISISSPPGGRSAGQPEDIYGAFNGAPAVFNINVNSVTPV